MDDGPRSSVMGRTTGYQDKTQNSLDFINKDLKCVDCVETFVFSAREQAFFKHKGFSNDPRRCEQCKAQREGARRRTETRVKCSECGIDTIVPFKPTQKRPVLCSNCFSNREKTAAPNLPTQETQ